MKKAPCIRLGMRINPKISENPDDNRNNNPPSAKLLIARMTACADVICCIMEEARVPDAVQRGVKRNGAPLIRDPGYFLVSETGVPGLQRTTSYCAAPGTREVVNYSKYFAGG